MKLLPTLRTISFFAFVLCVTLLLTSDASAFGKRGKGIFGWRGGSSQCESQSQGYAQGNCSNGQCAPASGSAPNTRVVVASDGKQYTEVCTNGKCQLVEIGSTGPGTLTTFSLKPVWADPAWQKK